ncbi:conjugal transfer protein [Antrihabitans spumae]|uniref:Conjugal transfer protein n=1 Tax=Antrihabitans spumae TaxID=3373370 RepID=A0ABW7KCU0_9NOCA
MKLDWKKINSFGRADAGSTFADAAAPQSDRDEIDDLAGAERRHWGLRQLWLTRLARGGLGILLLAGVLALVFAVRGSSTTSPQNTSDAAVPASIDTAAQAQAGELATQLVVTWLQASRGQEKDLERYVDTDPAALPMTALFVADEPAVASITRVSESVAPLYSVTVAVSVRPGSDGSAVAVRRYFQVPVVVSAAGARAATLPAEIAAPSSGAAVTLDYRYRIVNHPIVDSAGQFLSAMLTGSGEVARYVTPGASLSAVTPPPYRVVSISTTLASRDLNSVAPSAPLRDGDVVRLLVTATQKVTDNDAVVGQYALTMAARGGRWEVSAIDSAPLFPAAAPPSSATPTAPAGSTPKSASVPTSAAPAPAPAPAPASAPGPSAPALPPLPDVPLFSTSGAAAPAPHER